MRGLVVAGPPAPPRKGAQAWGSCLPVVSREQQQGGHFLSFLAPSGNLTSSHLFLRVCGQVGRAGCVWRDAFPFLSADSDPIDYL